MTILIEPAPVWPEAPRYCPNRAFPAYRFVPGLNPHPTREESGHSFGLTPEELTHIDPGCWMENNTYLFGVDLYHQSFFWESHEVWEQLWHLTDKNGMEGQFLQGLIQNSAAQLKLHMANMSGATHLSREAYRRFSFVMDQFVTAQKGIYMGLDLIGFLEQMHNHYSPLWLGQESLTAPPPRIQLSRR